MQVRRICRLTAGIALGTIVWGAAFTASAQSANKWPERPVRVITPAAPGGTTDFLARLFSAHLSGALKEQFIVDNRASQSGVLAAELTANAAPDGYTLFLAYHQHTINAALLPKLPYHPVNNFTPLTQLTAAGLMLVVHPDTPVKTFKDFMAWTKQQGGNLNFGSAGIGSGGHLAGELYKLMTGVNATHIPYKGTGPATTALLGKEYHFNFMGLSAATKLVSAGRLKGLAVTSTQRLKSNPEVPTVAESGIPGFEVIGWYGVMAPPKLPEPLLNRIHSEFIKALNDPKIQQAISDQGATPVGDSPGEFRKYLLADMEKWQKVVKASGAKSY